MKRFRITKYGLHALFACVLTALAFAPAGVAARPPGVKPDPADRDDGWVRRTAQETQCPSGDRVVSLDPQKRLYFALAPSDDGHITAFSCKSAAEAHNFTGLAIGPLVIVTAPPTIVATTCTGGRFPDGSLMSPMCYPRSLPLRVAKQGYTGAFTVETQLGTGLCGVLEETVNLGSTPNMELSSNRRAISSTGKFKVATNGYVNCSYKVTDDAGESAILNVNWKGP